MYAPADPDFEQSVRAFVLGMPAARHLGFHFGPIQPGCVELIQPLRPELTQQDGYLQGGILGALADFAGGAAAGTLLPAGWANMTLDYTIKIVARARGDRVVAHGRVINNAPVISVASAEIVSTESGVEVLCATALITVRNVRLSRKEER